MKISQKEFIEAELNGLNLTMNNPDFIALAQEVANYLEKHKSKSVIDYGCGTGVYSEVMRQNGFNIKAQDVFKVHRDYCKENYPELEVIARPVKSELMLFIEVAEHMTDEEIQKAIKTIDPELIIFSSTPEVTGFDADWGHINIKSENEWITFWAGIGYGLIDRPQTPTKWALMFERL